VQLVSKDSLIQKSGDENSHESGPLKGWKKLWTQFLGISENGH
jgi:hypothetical protein